MFQRLLQPSSCCWWCWWYEINPPSPFPTDHRNTTSFLLPNQDDSSPLSAPRPTTTTTTPSSSQARLDQLPPELLGAVAHHLPAHARIALKLCSKALCHKTPLQLDFRLEDCSVCAKNVLRRYRSEYKELREGRRYCVVCHTLQDAKYMRDGGGRICSFHGAMFVYPTPRQCTLNLGSGLLGLQCVGYSRKFCVHKGQVLWTANEQPCDCACQDCGHIDVICRLRV